MKASKLLPIRNAQERLILRHAVSVSRNPSQHNQCDLCQKQKPNFKKKVDWLAHEITHFRKQINKT